MIIKAIIEIPKWSKKKNEIKETGSNRVLYKVKKRFIANYGKIPGTIAGDGDNADIFVLGRRLKIGSTINATVLALVDFTHKEKEDNKVIAYTGRLTYLKRKQLCCLLKFLRLDEGTEAVKDQAAAEKYIESIRVHIKIDKAKKREILQDL